ncbi:TFIIIC_sub6 superfamily domain-containing protein [Histoplasma capsulatum]|uniref:TFIIIC_sub6 superfamily domain-containing protein n=1 Tax=Ajellomyces capsulatus TaxID=5037 RepID=A0A8A1M847_AJECA|nr:predicted protein [Histoplasma mississippiense (nom. inval.)]EDN07122.1 predicted protein [Histoplasma mississippiense (nom. inval.)]QSS61440.1 TFIIIC_sub6 superfamily domain-containing protein [Histoplasma capsulatum]
MVASDDSDSGYEYEYDDNSQETFYLNLDLTTCNGPIRVPRKRVASTPTAPTTSLDSPHVPSLNAGDDQQQDNTNADTDPDTQDQDQDQDQVQIMDLHSENPIISYRNQVFSCSWVDLVGTEMTFSMPEERSTLPRLRQHRDYDLISANRVKILGHKVNLITGSSEIPKAGSNNNNNKSIPTSAPIPDNDEVSTTPTAAAAAAAAAAALPRVPSTNQALFLERLMNAKRAKGESDIVRTTFSQKRNQNFEARLRGWARTGEQMAELEMLNRRVLQGDVNALRELEDIYARAEEPAGAGQTQEQE